MAIETATLAGGCFWCTEAVFNDVIGVETVTSGYIGGTIEHPTYKQVCSGNTGHAEVVMVVFDPEVFPFARLLQIFWESHDPTQGMRQGNDVGTQYRSAIFPHTPEQEAAAKAAIVRAQPDWPAPIVTTIEPLGTWWPAEDYHQQYWEGDGQRNPYCLAVIPPKIRKLRKSFAARAKQAAEG